MNIAEYLDQSGLTQVAFAQLIGVTQSTVAFWLHTKSPTIERCIQIEKATGGKVRCEDLRPDVDWAYLRGTVAADTPGGGDRRSRPRPLSISTQGANSVSSSCDPGSIAGQARTAGADVAGGLRTDVEQEVT